MLGDHDVVSICLCDLGDPAATAALCAHLLAVGGAVSLSSGVSTETISRLGGRMITGMIHTGCVDVSSLGMMGMGGCSIVSGDDESRRTEVGPVGLEGEGDKGGEDAGWLLPQRGALRRHALGAWNLHFALGSGSQL